jgi:site-specific DNA-methyltransferase (adenine-specific)
MFPPQLPYVFIRWLTEPGDLVYDPFSGRGTVPLEAALAGRRAYASDANPLAVALSRAKVHIPASSRARARITQLENRYTHPAIDAVPDQISMLYSKPTLRQLVYLKDALVRTRHVDGFLVAALLGLLHGNHSKDGATRGLSISMPNTFAMAPGYVRRYIADHRLEPPTVDVFQMLRRRIDQLQLPEERISGGDVWTQDVLAPPPSWLQQKRVKLIFTSPPYLQVIKYGKYNWVRLWFLGEDPKDVDQRLTDTSSMSRYRSFMRGALDNFSSVVRDDGYLCLVIGDVRRTDEDINLAEDVWENVASVQGWHLHGIVTDHLPAGRKVSRIWKGNPGRATKTDRILILRRGGPTAVLPGLDRIDWSKRPGWPSRVQEERIDQCR